MSPKDYRFITSWRFEADCGLVYDIIADAARYPQWMKDVKIEAVMLSPGNPDGTGRKDLFKIKGFLPYALTWQTECLEAERPTRIVSAASGELAGTGIWTFTQRRMWADVTFDWQVSFNHPGLAPFSFLLRPFFEANHNWVMDRWEKNLAEEIARRQG
jgi:hypothetical protein